MITEKQFQEAAAIIGCDVASIKAVYFVEAAGRGYLPDGRVKILFEGHRFWKQLDKAGKVPSIFAYKNPEFSNVLYQKWDKKQYKGGDREWMRMSQAIVVCNLTGASPELALRSASYGSFQIMGENFHECGYDSAQSMLSQYNLGGEAEQLNSFVRFLKSTHLDDELISHNWEAFAKGYNGTGYRENQYHLKLAFQFKKFNV